MSFSRPQSKAPDLRKWCVRLGAVLTILGTLSLLFVERSDLSMQWFQRLRIPSILDCHPEIRIETYDSSSRLGSTINETCMSGYMFFASEGKSPTIVDENGNLTWQESHYQSAQNLRVQSFRGEDYLTFWAREESTHGSYYMLDSSYTTRYILRPVGKVFETAYDFTVTHRDTAIISAQFKSPADLSAVGGPVDGWILDGVFQEIDIVTGSLLYEWRAAEHVPITDTFKVLDQVEGTEDYPFDFFHINGVDLGPSDDYLVSAAGLRSVMSIEGKTGQVQWSLGGKNNSNHDPSGRQIVDFIWPHNARWSDNDTLTVMDDGGAATTSRGMVIEVKPHTAQAAVRRIFPGSTEQRGHSAADIQVVPHTGHVLISWDDGRQLSEYTANGDLICENRLKIAKSMTTLGVPTETSHISKHTWIGKPLTQPLIKATGGRLYVSWNGATEVAEWQLEVRSQFHPSNVDGFGYHPVSHFSRKRYMTVIRVPQLQGSGTQFVRVAALDRQGQVLGYTREVEWHQAWTGSDLSQAQIRVLAGVCIVGGMMTILSTLHIQWRSRQRNVSLLPVNKY